MTKPIAEFIVRLNDEIEQLSARMLRLAEFIDDNEEFTKLPLEQQLLLEMQLRAMGLYKFTIQRRYVLLTQNEPPINVEIVDEPDPNNS
jgi:hypothetical protein